MKVSKPALLTHLALHSRIFGPKMFHSKRHPPPWINFDKFHYVSFLLGYSFEFRPAEVPFSEIFEKIVDFFN